MPSQLDQLQFNYSLNVPEHGFPLAHLNIPIPVLSQNLKLVGTGQFAPENTSGLIRKNISDNVAVNYSNTVSSLSVSGILSSNKVGDSTFRYGITPTTSASWSATAGTWNALTTGGRTSANSTYETGDEPGLGQSSVYQPYCLYVDWLNYTNNVSIQSNSIPVISSSESSFGRSNIVFQAGLWIASDPVDDSSIRRGSASWQTQDIRNSRIYIQIDGYDSSNVYVKNLLIEYISASNVNQKQYFNQAISKYLRYRTSYFRVQDTNIQYIRITIGGTSIQGIYLDDITLRSYAYVNLGNRNNSSENFYVAEPNVINNPEFRDDNFTTGDFSTAFTNLLDDPSFEFQRTWSHSGSYKFGTSEGSPRTGNVYMETDFGGENAVQTVSGIDYTKAYIASAYLRREDNTYNVTGYLKVESLNSSDVVLDTWTTTVSPTSSSYEKISINFSPSGSSAAVKLKFTIQAVSAGGFTRGILWDDLALYSTADIINNWTEYVSQAIDTASSVLNYNEAYNKFTFIHYTVSGTGKYHQIFPLRTIYKDNLYSFTPDYITRYFNTRDYTISDSVNITVNKVYGLNFNLLWKGHIPNITLNGDNTIRGAFSEPFRILYTTTAGTFINDINKYGYVKATVQGLSSTGAVLETPLDYVISPQYSNLPKDQLFGNGVYYSVMNLPRFKFTNASTTKARVIFEFVATVAGISNISFNPYTETTSGSSNTATQVYTFNNKIEVDGAVSDNTDAWRLLIKDGIFEKLYTVPSYEPSGSWLLKAGYLPGQQLKLIYTIPEYNLELQEDEEKHLDKSHRIKCFVVDENTLFLGNRNIAYIGEVYFNGNLTITGSVDSKIELSRLPLLYPDIVESVDEVNGFIKFKKSLNDGDFIEATYLYRQIRYVYKGFNRDNVWYDLDLNPSDGHRYHIAVDGVGKPSRELMNSGATLYLIPSAAYLASGDVSGVYTFSSALNLDPIDRPVSFVRHVIGIDNDTQVYAEYPSANILGKIFVEAPGSISDIKILDVRSRGGGLEENWDPNLSNKPNYFTEETRVRIPQQSEEWTNTKVVLYNNDVFSFIGLGVTSGSSGEYTVYPINSIYGKISTTRPSSGTTGFLLGNNYRSTIGYSSSSMSPSGLLYVKIVNSLKGNSGDLYGIIRTRRKFYEGSNWDFNSWEGEPVMMNGVVVIEVPKDVLTGTNGYRKFTNSEIEEIVNKHVAAGVLPIINYV